ncbi:MAG: adenylate/guanylate cyclase domain-containing protein [Alphaproteobacteria bacterium]
MTELPAPSSASNAGPRNRASQRAARTPRERRSWSITVILGVGFTGLIALAVGAVMGLALWSAGQNTIDLLRDKVKLSVDTLVNDVETQLRPVEDQIRFLGTHINVGTLDLADDAGLQKLLLGAIAATPNVRTLSVVRRDLSGVGVIQRDRETRASILDFRDDTQVRATIDAGAKLSEMSWLPPAWRASANETWFSLQYPLYRGGEYRGLLVATISIGDLSAILRRLDVSTQATPFILLGRNQVLAHPNLTAQFPGQGDAKPLPALADVGDRHLARMFDPAIRLRQNFAVPEPVQAIIAGFDDGEHLFYYMTSRERGGQPWLIGFHLAADTVSTEINRLITSALGGVVALVLGVFAAFLIGRNIARPIAHLSDAAAHVSQLRFENLKEMPKSRIREIDQQARAFNSMLTALRWFETYVPRSLVHRLLREGELAGVTSDARDLTVMFTDIVGFSRLSENMKPAELANLLNEHFAIVAKCIEAEGGTVDKFMGDAVMAFWGAPEKTKHRAEHACNAALAIKRAIHDDNARRQARGLAPIHMRIGIHTGEATVGNIGAPGRINYTIVGDTVNVAQRLEQLGKVMFPPDTEVAILISAATATDLSAEFQLDPVGERDLRGRNERIAIFRLM